MGVSGGNVVRSLEVFFYAVLAFFTHHRYVHTRI